MAFKVSFVIVTACLVSSILASPTTVVSYIEDIKVSYENGQWVCGILDCPVASSEPELSQRGTYGCSVRRKTDSEDKTIVYTTYTCFNEKKKGVASAGFANDMYRSRNIDIELESYVGAVSVYYTSYGLGGNESAKGVVAPDGWTELKANAAENRKAVEDSNA